MRSETKARSQNQSGKNLNYNKSKYKESLNFESERTQNRSPEGSEYFVFACYKSTINEYNIED